MYSIDLLKGDGIPIRSRPGGIAFACLLVAVPVLMTIGAVTFYMDCNVIIAIKKKQVHRLEAVVETLSDAVQQKETLEREKTEALTLLGDVSTALQEHAQWSNVLTEVVESISDALILTRLEASEDKVRRRVPAKDDPTKRIDVSVPVRTLRIRVCGREKQVSYDAVRDLQDRLRSSAQVGPMLDTITVCQESELLDGAEAVLYELHCTFKPLIQ